MPLCHLEGRKSAAVVINNSGSNSTADTNRKCFFFIWWKGRYRKPSHVGQEAEVTEDRARTARGGCVLVVVLIHCCSKHLNSLNSLAGEPQRAF